MNYLNGKKVYLCGPIHSVKDYGIQWRKSIAPRLIEMGIEVLDPCKEKVIGNITLSEVGKNKIAFSDMVKSQEWGKVKKDFWPIVRYDLRCVDHCDFIIFNYDPIIPMVGSIHELVVATFEKKVILLKYNREQIDDFNPWIATFIKEHHFFSEWDDMFKHLEEVNQGIFDTSLWVI